MANDAIGLSAAATFQEAERLLEAGDTDGASRIYLALTKEADVAPRAFFRLARLQNEAGKPSAAKTLYYRALTLRPDLCKLLLPPSHPNHDYVFEGMRDEPVQPGCPLCGGAGEAHWCYFLPEMGSAHVRHYNPVRVWMRCGRCNHLYAEEFPVQTVTVSPPGSPPPAGMTTRPQYLGHFSRLLNRLSQYTKGTELLEVGVGGCECSMAARELGYRQFGIDISEGCVLQARRYGLAAEQHDFLLFEPDRQWDIIIMGDVIEHVSSPVDAMNKARGLLRDDGVIWLSTPNFESAFSVFSGHRDPMRREGGHRNYFSRDSLFQLLESTGFVPVRQEISSRFNGSMEVIACPT